MPRQKRIGVKSLQTRVAGWVHEFIAERKVPGVDKRVIVEETFRMRIEAEETAKEVAQVVGASTGTSTRAKDYTDSDSYEVYCWAAAAIETYFEKQPDVFMHTLSQLRGEKKSLSVRDWREWVKTKRVPEKYVPTIRTVITVTNGLDRARRLAGVFDAVGNE